MTVTNADILFALMFIFIMIYAAVHRLNKIEALLTTFCKTEEKRGDELSSFIHQCIYGSGIRINNK